MVMFPPVVTGGMGGAATGSVGVAGGSTGTATFPGAGSTHGGWEEEDMSYPGSGSGSRQGTGGFDYQGKPYDPMLNDPMAVSAETHGDFWEDDIDYSETVSYEGVDTKAGAQAKTMTPPITAAVAATATTASVDGIWSPFAAVVLARGLPVLVDC